VSHGSEKCGAVRGRTRQNEATGGQFIEAAAIKTERFDTEGARPGGYQRRGVEESAVPVETRANEQLGSLPQRRATCVAGLAGAFGGVWLVRLTCSCMECAPYIERCRDCCERFCSQSERRETGRKRLIRETSRQIRHRSNRALYTECYFRQLRRLGVAFSLLCVFLLTTFHFISFQLWCSG